ncbi:MAG: isoprenylcysteine carboxylmethyltransferase family protein [Balneolaceae bacterium]|nr:isoprenylcysteine carboxylmethyltransferase family protein [Balneolaceae bacterium]
MLKLRVPPALVFIICLGLMWGIHRYFSFSWSVIEAKAWLYSIPMIAGVLIALAGTFEFSRNKTTVNPHKPENTSVFVQSGIYRISRNPMYLGMALILAGAALKWGHMANLLVPPLFILYMNTFQILPEEEVMEQKFGEAFREYKERVRRWV